jgi:hypothetical protein
MKITLQFPLPLWSNSPQCARASSFKRFLDHTQRSTTVGRTPLNEWPARCRDLYLTTHNTHNRQTSMPPVGFEHTISAGERPQTYVLDRAATGTGNLTFRSLFGFEPKIWKFNKQRSIHGFDHAATCCEMWWSSDEINYTYPGCGCGKFVCVHQLSISFALYLNGFNLISRINIKHFLSTIKKPVIVTVIWCVCLRAITEFLGT